MNKNDVVSYIADCAGISKAKASRCINCYHNAIELALGNGDKVSFVGFGTFKVNKRNARIGVNPQTKAKIQIPARDVPVFKAGKKLREAVK